MYTSNNKIETRIWVKITFNEKGISALQQCVYFRNEMSVEFFQRWKWFFEYRAALLRVKHPKAYISYRHSPYEYVLPEDKYREKVRNRYLADKRLLTKFQNRLNAVRENWNELFPIEENPEWNKVVEKMNYYQEQLRKSKEEYELVFNSIEP